jgi:hypothetical protein
VIAKSPVGESESLSVALLSPPLESLKPTGGVSVAVFETELDAEADTVAFTVNVAEPPEPSETVVAIEPVPFAAPQVPPAAAHVQVAFVSALGRTSLIAIPVATDGPLLVTAIVYAVGDPGTTVVVPFVFVIDRFPAGVSPSVSVAWLSADDVSVVPAGGETEAVFESEPVVPGATVADNR